MPTTASRLNLPDIEADIPPQVPATQREALIKLGFQGKAAIYLPEAARFDRIGELTVNVAVRPAVCQAGNGGEYVELAIARSANVASTSDGRFYLRIADESKPVLGDDVMRLANERSALPWETLTTLEVSRGQADPAKAGAFLAGIRSSDRVKPSVKEKSVDELLDHYQLARGEWLTHLGVLCVGKQSDRARLGTAPVIQFVKRDAQEHKVNKLSWDDHTLSPMELVDEVWRDVPDFREFYEVADGLFRTQVPAFDERVIRELLINALVHGPYTQRGDIYLNLHADRLEIVNPGPLPLGVTPDNVLHASVRRNEHLARLCHDLKLMEREGSGFDAIYDVLLSQGRPAPVVEEGPDWVRVTLARTAPDRQVLAFIAKAGESYPLTQRERIALGLLARHEALTARELAARLELTHADQVAPVAGSPVRMGIGGPERPHAGHALLRAARAAAHAGVPSRDYAQAHRGSPAAGAGAGGSGALSRIGVWRGPCPDWQRDSAPAPAHDARATGR
jgi:ATP-dependent DNA helicase RecG